MERNDMEYIYKKLPDSKGSISGDGHTMFLEDVVKELKALRKERDELREELNQHKTVLSHCNFGGNMPIKNKLSIVAENKRLRGEVKLLNSYIDLWREESQTVIPFAHGHGWRANKEHVKRGERIRKQLEALKKKGGDDMEDVWSQGFKIGFKTCKQETEPILEQLRKERDDLREACGEAYIYFASCLVHMEDSESHKNLKNMAMKMRDLSEETPTGKE